ncbi:hypothetical protein C1I98_28565 [Spongiactinospora gelatinilytica]|uniref:Uncharacterized protein n=1 Tax=Spongiactinospora gelatinilytica TaxID=2666298 RepID=A0A2W2H3Y7_9ACTN|nr:hypothetical protein [Spongiactinospora gelatinilytica]PZG33714.1 hypothetical protein C1I98_28565 [Spongiactinospora gelatinilytica]
MTAPTADQLDELRELLDRLPAGPWHTTDCEGRIEVWQESALTRVTRDEHGEITGYSTPSAYLASHLLYERYVDTWDRGERDGEDDDLRRDIAELLAAARNVLPGLLAEMERVRALARDLTDPGECRYDHHGHCQPHGWTQAEPRCPHARARELLREETA